VERTPCRRSRTLSEITGAEVWLKFENLQFTASYKERVALNRLSRLTAEERRRGVIAASAGNHAQGLAYHGQRLGIPVTIVMPRATPHVKVQQTREFGATVVMEGDSYDAANEIALTLRDERGLVFVHPFDDLDVMAGQGTLALEMLEDAPDIEVMPVPIGGGGLISGVATAAKSVKPDIHIIGVEPAMYPSFTARMRGLNAPCGGQTIAARGAVLRARGRALLQCREDRHRRGRRRGPGRAAGLSGAVPRQGVRPDHHRRQHRPAPAGLGADPRTGARAEAGLATHHRR
jgi:threonine dehydratase